MRINLVTFISAILFLIVYPNWYIGTMKPDSVKLTDTSPEPNASEKVRSILSKEKVLKILKKIVISERFDLLDYNFHSIDEINGYLGLYHTLVTSVKYSDIIEEHKFFVKTQPLPCSLQYKFMIELNAFVKEARMYKEIIPEMQGVDERCSKWGPKCYLVSEQVLVLEDLSAQGYVMPNKYVIFDRDHCAIFLKTMAKFHAGSFVLEDKLKSKKITLFDMYGDVLGEPLFKEGTMSKMSHRSCILGVNSVIDLVHQLKEQEKSELKNRTKKWFENIAEKLKPSKNYRNIICHRDLWANNFFFKYNADSGQPEACRLIDLQFICYGTPAIDYMTALYLTTDRETRKNNEQLFQRIYYDTLKKELESEGLDVSDCLEWSTFLQSCEDSRSATIAYALMNLPIILLDAEVREKLFTQSEFLKETIYNDRSAMLRQQFLDVQPFRERMTDVILEAHELLSNYMEEKL